MSRTNGRMTGSVKTIVRDKGFGFIKVDATGQEWFFHRTGMEDRMEYDRLNEGDRVSFQQGDSPKGPRAEAVRVG